MIRQFYSVCLGSPVFMGFFVKNIFIVTSNGDIHNFGNNFDKQLLRLEKYTFYDLTKENYLIPIYLNSIKASTDIIAGDGR